MSNNHTLPTIFLMGPTGSGKTDLAISLVQQSDCEIISVDSAMIYRGMDIGTAKPSQHELSIAPHHLIDIRNPNESYSVAEFCRDASLLIKDIHTRNKIPLLVGGTIMYFHSLQFGLSQLPAANEQLRSSMNEIGEQRGWAALHEKLQQVDPESAAKIHRNDAQRIQRALEVFELTGAKLSSYQSQKKSLLPDTPLINIGLFPEDRSQLHQNIASRFDQMLKKGVIDELKELQNTWSLTAKMPSMRCIGYRQIWEHLENETPLELMRDQSIAATRQLAKRQLTWLRHYSETKLIDPYTTNIDQMSRQIIYQLQ